MGRSEKTFKGFSISSGYAIGKALFYPTFEVLPLVASKKLSKRQEYKKFSQSIKILCQEISQLKDKGLETNEVIEAHLNILNSPGLKENIKNYIRQGLTAEKAVRKYFKQIATKLEKSENKFFKQRAIDLHFLSKELVKIMQNYHFPWEEFKDKILVSYELGFIDGLKAIKKGGVKGFILGGGGKTSHLAIILRDFGIPAVFGLGEKIHKIKNNSRIILDGYKGIVILNPLKKTIKRYEELINIEEERKKKLLDLKEKEPVTTDGKRIELSANIEFPEEVDTMEIYGSYGIGLFRTEALYLMGNFSLEYQENVYKKIAKKVYPNMVIIRLLDIGLDKIREKSVGKNPFLGIRGIRFLLHNPEILKTQLKAILKANKEVGNIKIMIPMVSFLEEIFEIKQYILKISDEEKIEEIPELGIMVETPSAALNAYEFAKHVAFFSIGTNDLIQYTLAVDRTNEKLHEYFTPFYPSVLKLIKKITEDGHKNHIWVGVCGEMASDLKGALTLIGMDIDELSVIIPRLLEIKKLIRKVKQETLMKDVEEMLNIQTIKEIEKYMEEKWKDLLKEFYYFQ